MGARWNSKGTELIYTSASRALAMAEVFIHLSLNKLPSDFVMLEINIPETLKMGTVTAKELPERWNEFPYRFNTQQFGDGLVSDNNYAFYKYHQLWFPAILIISSIRIMRIFLK